MKWKESLIIRTGVLFNLLRHSDVFRTRKDGLDTIWTHGDFPCTILRAGVLHTMRFTAAAGENLTHPCK